MLILAVRTAHSKRAWSSWGTEGTARLSVHDLVRDSRPIRHRTAIRSPGAARRSAVPTGRAVSPALAEGGLRRPLLATPVQRWRSPSFPSARAGVRGWPDDAQPATMGIGMFLARPGSRIGYYSSGRRAPARCWIFPIPPTPPPPPPPGHRRPSPRSFTPRGLAQGRSANPRRCGQPRFGMAPPPAGVSRASSPEGLCPVPRVQLSQPPESVEQPMRVGPARPPAPFQRDHRPPQRLRPPGGHRSRRPAQSTAWGDVRPAGKPSPAGRAS